MTSSDCTSNDEVEKVFIESIPSIEAPSPETVDLSSSSFSSP